MTALYEILILGMPQEDELIALKNEVEKSVNLFNLKLEENISWITDANYSPSPNITSVAVFFGAPQVVEADLSHLLRANLPILPVATKPKSVNQEIPASLKNINCIFVTEGTSRIASALLECLGLLPRQRRVFLSYRRDEARQAALQLFDALSERLFEVFLDTHGVPPAEDFQTTLWHRLCDSDVLVMLDTPGYFESRWTSAEFGRALAKGISVLRIGWPDATPSIRTETASRVELLSKEINSESGALCRDAITRICTQLEIVRSESHAVRQINLVSGIKIAVERIHGKVLGIGMNNAMHIELPNGTPLIAYPAVGVPTSTTLHDAAEKSLEGSSAVIFDHIGLHPKWLGHLDWLGNQVKNARWLKVSEAAWTLADWEV